MMLAACFEIDALMWLQERNCKCIQPGNIHELAAATFRYQILFSLIVGFFPKKKTKSSLFYAHASFVSVYLERLMQ